MRRGLIMVLVIACALVAGAALIIRSPGLRAALLPGPVQAFLDRAGLAALAGGNVEPKTAQDFLHDSARGLEARGPIAASAGNRPVFIDEMVSGYTTRNETSVPAEITTIRPILGCQLTRPQPGTLVGHATAGDSGMPLGLTTYGDAHLAAAVQDFVDAYRKIGPEGEIRMTGPRYQAYDVAVTETSAPVYLVLDARGGLWIWNIHLAEGVRIERVVLLGGTEVGVANLDPVVPVEVILARGLEDCGLQPANAPSPGQIADTTPEAGDQPMRRADLDQALALAEAYDIWFRDNFEVRAGESRVGFDVGTLSVIGPVPQGDAPRAVWASIDGAKLRMTHDTYLDIEGQIEPGQDFAGRVVAITTGFALGNLDWLLPSGAY